MVGDSRTSFILPRDRRRIMAGLAFAAALLALPAKSAEPDTFSASYSISLAGIQIGRADAESRFNSRGYSLAIRGYTSGISRLVSDATAILASNGRFSRDRVLPSHYDFENTENGNVVSVRMAMQSGSVVSVSTDPTVGNIPNRVPIRSAHRTNVVDPSSAFIIPVDRRRLGDGNAACNRTLRVFDGWQRFDIRLSYTRTETVSSRGDGYTGKVFVCAARYVPVAGHMNNRDSVEYMANNKQLEVWLAPVGGDLGVLVPYQIKIGTKVGSLTIRATRFAGLGPDAQASAQ